MLEGFGDTWKAGSLQLRAIWLKTKYIVQNLQYVVGLKGVWGYGYGVRGFWSFRAVSCFRAAGLKGLRVEGFRAFGILGSRLEGLRHRAAWGLAQGATHETCKKARMGIVLTC